MINWERKWKECYDHHQKPCFCHLKKSGRKIGRRLLSKPYSLSFRSSSFISCHVMVTLDNAQYSIYVFFTYDILMQSFEEEKEWNKLRHLKLFWNNLSHMTDPATFNAYLKNKMKIKTVWCDVMLNACLRQTQVVIHLARRNERRALFNAILWTKESIWLSVSVKWFSLCFQFI